MGCNMYIWHMYIDPVCICHSYILSRAAITCPEHPARTAYGVFFSDLYFTIKNQLSKNTCTSFRILGQKCVRGVPRIVVVQIIWRLRNRSHARTAYSGFARRSVANQPPNIDKYLEIRREIMKQCIDRKSWLYQRPWHIDSSWWCEGIRRSAQSFWSPRIFANGHLNKVAHRAFAWRDRRTRSHLYPDHDAK